MHFKVLHPLEVLTVEHINFFYVLASEDGQSGILFCKSEYPQPSEETLASLEDTINNVFREMRIPYYYPKSMRRHIRKYGVTSKVSKARYNFFSKIWNPIQRRCLLPGGKPTHH